MQPQPHVALFAATSQLRSVLRPPGKQCPFSIPPHQLCATSAPSEKTARRPNKPVWDGFAFYSTQLLVKALPKKLSSVHSPHFSISHTCFSLSSPSLPTLSPPCPSPRRGSVKRRLQDCSKNQPDDRGARSTVRASRL